MSIRTARVAVLLATLVLILNSFGFVMLFSAAVDVAAQAGAPAVRIAEIHYDNAGTDTGEAIEISGPAGTDLTGWSIVLYNGNGGATYNSRALSGTLPATCGSRGVVVATYPTDGIQNGSPDDVALVSPTGLIEFLSYEGTFAGVGGPANGITSSDIGVTEGSTQPIGESLQRNFDGTWDAPAASTFGACNDEDPPPPNEVISVVVTPNPATIVEGGTRLFAATALDVASEPVAGISITWMSSEPSIVTIDATGLARGIAVGEATITATAPNGVSGTATVAVNPPPPPPSVRVTELHYDNLGTDANEAIEIEGPAGSDLTGWSVVLYNGDSRSSYNTRSLAGVIPAGCADRGVVVLFYLENGIQNGGPDGLALVDPNGIVVEFLSYEGSFTAADGAAAGLVSTDIIASQNSARAGLSLQRGPDHQWLAAQSTFGLCNGTPQAAGSTIAFSGRAGGDAALPVGFEDQLFATLSDSTGATVPTTFTWSSATPAIASIDQDAVFRALAPGTAVLVAVAADGTAASFALPIEIGVLSTTAIYAGNVEFGIPTDGDPTDDHLVEYPQYMASYNPQRGTANWVSYALDPTHFGPEDRCDCFTFDQSLPATFTRYTTADYTGAGAFHGFGIDRGHLARSFDRTSGSLDNARTFYFTNIVPQAADLNQGPWANFENYLGGLAQAGGKEVYIVTGVAGSTGTVKNEGLIVIPQSTWKVAVVVPHDTGLAQIVDYRDLEVIAVNMPNQPGIRNVPWQTYLTTVDEIEALTGYDLLSLLPDKAESAVESDTDPPFARADGPYTSLEGIAIAMSATASFDPNGSVSSYAWNFGDGATATGPEVNHVYSQDGIYTVTLTVTDNDGLTDQITTTATVVSRQQVLQDAAAIVDALVAGQKISASAGRGLKAKLSGAVKNIDAGDDAGAVEKIESAIDQLNALVTSGRLADADAASLLSLLAQVMQSLEW
jgi:DNA/RNA endonuclease G (NUC1)